MISMFLALWLPLWGQLLLAALVLGVWLLLRHSRRTFAYWENKGVPTCGTARPLVGSMWRVITLKEHMLHFFHRIYKEEVKGRPFIGYYQGHQPALLVCSPELTKHILVKDFAHFVDHGLEVNEEADPLQAKNLFNMNGNKWRELRAKLTPTFTSGRMKAMLPLMLDVAKQLDLHLGKNADSGENFEVKDLVALYTTDVIGSCAFGIQCDSLANPNNQFRLMGRKLTELSFLAALRSFIIVFMPKVGKFFKLAMIDQELTTFFRKMVRDVVALRSRTGEIRRDFMQLLIELKEKGKIAAEADEKIDPESNGNLTENWQPSAHLKLTDDELTAQATVFFLAGFETSSTVISFALLELSRRPYLQTRARNEIKSAIQRNGGQLNYQALQDMHFLDAIMHESMRMYPPVANLMRVCTKNYVLPGSDVTIEEGTPVLIPIHAMQNDPKYFPDPTTFDPDRFYGETHNPAYVHMPFGEGPRQCIGNRFALLQSKVCLASFLQHYEVRPCERTNYPPKLSRKQFILTDEDGIWLRLLKVSDSEE